MSERGDVDGMVEDHGRWKMRTTEMGRRATVWAIWTLDAEDGPHRSEAEAKITELLGEMAEAGARVLVSAEPCNGRGGWPEGEQDPGLLLARIDPYGGALAYTYDKSAQLHGNGRDDARPPIPTSVNITVWWTQE